MFWGVINGLAVRTSRSAGRVLTDPPGLLSLPPPVGTAIVLLSGGCRKRTSQRRAGERFTRQECEHLTTEDSPSSRTSCRWSNPEDVKAMVPLFVEPLISLGQHANLPPPAPSSPSTPPSTVIAPALSFSRPSLAWAGRFSVNR